MKKLLSLLLGCLISFQAIADTNAVLPFQHWTTAKGTRVYFYPAQDLPMVDIKVAFYAGSAYDHNKLGIAELTASLLDEGAGGMNADQIAEALETLGAVLNIRISRDASVISLRSLSESTILPQALTLLRTIIGNPSFSQKAISRKKRQQVAAIQQNKQSPSTIASLAFFKKLYGDHPYANPTLGKIETITKISKRDIKTFHQTYYVAKNMVIIIVGQLSRKKASTIADEISNSVAKGMHAKPLPDPKATNEKTVSEEISYPATQSNIRIGQIGISRADADYFPLMVGNYVLGGGMVSRLYNEVREKRGLSYSVYSTFYPMVSKGPFLIGLATRNNQSKQALTVSTETLENYINTGPSKEELALAKQYLVGSFPLSLESNSAIADNLLLLGFYQLPLNYFETYRSMIKNVSQKQVREAFQKHLDPKKMVIIRVGKNTA